MEHSDGEMLTGGRTNEDACRDTVQFSSKYSPTDTTAQYAKKS
jgi:hypothetical protein